MAEGSFLVKGTTNDLSISISKNYIDFSRGTWGIFVESIGICPSPTKVTVTDGKIYASKTDLQSSAVSALLYIDCNSVIGNFIIGHNLYERRVPLCHFHLDLNDKCFFHAFPTIYWHTLNNFNGHLKFNIKSNFEQGNIASFANEIQIYFRIKRLY